VAEGIRATRNTRLDSAAHLETDEDSTIHHHKLRTNSGVPPPTSGAVMPAPDRPLGMRRPRPRYWGKLAEKSREGAGRIRA
jgi:hypothetical protein